jgi:NAD(P)-dependent dehydrogenase (short-subunit alcohol dehydrogenase family)
VLGLLLASKAASPLFPASGGAIINISSKVSTLSPPGALAYVSSKSAVDGIEYAWQWPKQSWQMMVHDAADVSHGLLPTIWVIGFFKRS